MKKYIYILPLLLLSFTACDSVLDTTDLMNKNSDNFPSTPAEVQNLLAGVYQPMAKEQFGEFLISTIASDEAFGGGGPDDFMSTALDNLNKSNDNMLSSTWTNYYAGIYRANRLLESIGNVKYVFQKDKKQVLGETYFMRAWYHFSLARIFGQVPVMTTSEKLVLPKAPVAKLYGQIASDLKLSIDSFFPNDERNILPVTSLGHANLWAAQALLARVYLFYTGYYQTDVLPLADGTSLTKKNVIDILENGVANFAGYELATDYRTLWPYTNKYTVEDYLFTSGKNLLWKGELGANMETVFAIKFGNLGKWGSSAMNAVNVAFGLRGQTDMNKGTFPFGAGWGQGTVNKKMVDLWKTEEPTDPRIKMSILDVKDPAEGIKDYQEGGMSQMNDTHMFNKKYTPIMAKAGGKLYYSYTTPMFGSSDIVYEHESQDIVLIRFSDVLLMYSELTETNDGLNMVRARVGLPPVAYSFAALEKERRHELAFEGVRYFDLLRWYRKDAGAILQNNQNGVEVTNAKVKGTMSYNFISHFNETGGFWPIPAKEIALSNGVLVQNPGWDK